MSQRKCTVGGGFHPFIFHHVVMGSDGPRAVVENGAGQLMTTPLVNVCMLESTSANDATKPTRLTMTYAEFWQRQPGQRWKLMIPTEGPVVTEIEGMAYVISDWPKP